VLLGREFADLLARPMSLQALAEAVAGHVLTTLPADGAEIRLSCGPVRDVLTVRLPEMSRFPDWPEAAGARSSGPGHCYSAGTRLPQLWAEADAGTICVRLLVDEEHWAVLRALREGSDAWPNDLALAHLEAMAVILGVGMTHLRQVDELRAMADEDPLTGLANRRSLHRAAETALNGERARGVEVGVLVADVDGLKRVNDTWGHSSGDRLLQAVAQCLRGTFARVGCGLLARTGGDEFCVLVTGIPFQRLRTLAEELCAAGRELPYGGRLSVGLATTSWLEPTANFSQLYALADAAQYQAKRAGGDRVGHPCLVEAH
jgi:diguanylate cyclase (GGDEF)-like protein